MLNGPSFFGLQPREPTEVHRQRPGQAHLLWLSAAETKAARQRCAPKQAMCPARVQSAPGSPGPKYTSDSPPEGGEGLAGPGKLHRVNRGCSGHVRLRRVPTATQVINFCLQLLQSVSFARRGAPCGGGLLRGPEWAFPHPRSPIQGRLIRCFRNLSPFTIGSGFGNMRARRHLGATPPARNLQRHSVPQLHAKGISRHYGPLPPTTASIRGLVQC